jgi:hypothetical protein
VIRLALLCTLLAGCSWLKSIWSASTEGETFKLTDEERAVVKLILPAVDTSKVRLVFDAPASLGSTRTIGNHVHFAKTLDITKDRKSQRYWRTLLHEVCHVWQYQRYGAAYVVDALGPQFEAHRATGSRSNAYLYRLERKLRLRSYNGEQQCQIVGDYVGGAPRYCLNCGHDWRERAWKVIGEMR